MKQIDEIKLLLKNVIIDTKVNVPIIKLKDTMSDIQRVCAQQAYQNQTEDKKKLPLSRFWKNHNISLLTEQFALAIAEQIVKTDFKYERNKLPSTLNELIDKKIEQIKNHIEFEVMVEKMNKESHDQKIAFLSSLNDKSWLKPI